MLLCSHVAFAFASQWQSRVALTDTVRPPEPKIVTVVTLYRRSLLTLIQHRWIAVPEWWPAKAGDGWVSGYRVDVGGGILCAWSARWSLTEGGQSWGASSEEEPAGCSTGSEVPVERWQVARMWRCRWQRLWRVWKTKLKSLASFCVHGKKSKCFRKINVAATENESRVRLVCPWTWFSIYTLSFGSLLMSAVNAWRYLPHLCLACPSPPLILHFLLSSRHAIWIIPPLPWMSEVSSSSLASLLLLFLPTSPRLSWWCPPYPQGLVRLFLYLNPAGSLRAWFSHPSFLQNPSSGLFYLPVNCCGNSTHLLPPVLSGPVWYIVAKMPD